MHLPREKATRGGGSRNGANAERPRAGGLRAASPPRHRQVRSEPPPPRRFPWRSSQVSSASVTEQQRDLAGSCHYVPGSRRRRTQRATRHGPPAVDDDGAFPGGAERALRAPGPPSHGGSQGQVAQQARPAACRKGQRCMVATAASGAGGGELQGDGRAGRKRCEAQPDTPAAVRLGRRQAEGDGATQTYLQHARPRHDDGQNQVRVREVR